jgi:hypothetical protein
LITSVEPSVEPPSMTKYSSPGCSTASVDSMVRSRYGRMLKHGVTTVTRNAGADS